MLLGHRESSELVELITAFETWLRECSGALDPSQRERLQTQLVSNLSVIDARLSQGDEQEAVRLLRSLLIELGVPQRKTMIMILGSTTDTVRGEPMGNTRSPVQRNGHLTSLLDVLGLRSKAAPLVTYPTLRVPSAVREKPVFLLEIAARAQPSLDGNDRVSFSRQKEDESVDLHISEELPKSDGVSARSVRVDLMALGDVQQCLRGSPRAQVIHFACHGQSKAAEVIAEALCMQDGELHATDIPIPSPGTAGPIEGALVFLNACQAGIEERGLWSHSGWASKLLYAGVGAVIAPSWTITDAGALGFAEHFYRNAKSGLSLSESARRARKQIGHLGNLDRIGYAVYATPNAVANFDPKAEQVRECV